MPSGNLPPHFSLQARVYRATSYDVPLRVAANRRSGRWNIAGAGTVQYLCLDAEAPYAEKIRHEDLRSEAEAGTYTVALWELEVNEGLVVDYGTFEKAEAAGFPAEALVDDDHERCQKEARRLASLGARGVLSPSAALPGSTNLTLFGQRVEVRWGARPGVASAVPAQRLSVGHAPPGLVERVRFFGAEHPLLAEHVAAKAKRKRG
ncbi:MAG TPA: RES family NAD+ phosphorylase [Solirubrobacterales bacterium]|nr:RES family NAD+ phosphorylase [Solirubrobacterales bacterium]